MGRALMKLFLDANIYLGFYKLSEDDLEELRKLVVAVNDDPNSLILTQQVVDEFERNREGIIAESLRMMDDSKLPKSFPRLFMNYPEYEDLREALQEFESQRGTLLSRARADAQARTLHADQLIGELFDAVPHIARDAAILEAAGHRAAAGNPPGKGGSLGDAINWESLLGVVPDGEELLFVSADTDFASGLDPGRLDAFLAEEWRNRKGSGIEFHRSLSSLFRSRYSHISLASELERELAIGRLVGSGTFAATHAAIRELSQFTDFTEEQVATLVDTPGRNNQVGWILGDPDVQDFFRQILRQYPEWIDPDRALALDADLAEAADFYDSAAFN
jgi:hypothetical protein